MTYKDATDKCDFNDLQNEWHFWYKVSGNAGNALASLTAPSKNRCGTKRRVYLKTSHPVPSEGEVTRKVCITSKDDVNCAEERNIQVINCGGFYLYKLVEMSNTCQDPWRYCTSGKPGETIISLFPLSVHTGPVSNGSDPILERTTCVHTGPFRF